MEEEKNINEEINNTTMFKRIEDYEPIDFLKALIDNYKDRWID